MAHPISPIPCDPTPTMEMLRDRLLRTRETLGMAVEVVEALDGPDRIRAAIALNCYATPLINAIDALRPRTLASEPA